MRSTDQPTLFDVPVSRPSQTREQQRSADLAVKPKSLQAVPQRGRLAMFAKPPLYTGRAGPTLIDWSTDELRPLTGRGLQA